MIQDDYHLIKNSFAGRTKRLWGCGLDNPDLKVIKILFSRKVRMPWMFFSSAYKFIYCQIPKVASSNWMEIMSQLEGNLHRNKAKNIHSVKLPVITSMKYPGFKAIFNRYRKFMVIREPFKRVVSAYKDKLLPFKNLNRTKFHRLAKFITYYYRSANSSNKNFFPSFEEFIAFITDAGAVATKYKPHYSEPRHWMPQTSLCYPCNIDYDYILELDRVAVESKYLFERLEVPENTTFPKSKRHLNQTYLFPAYDNETMEYFRSVSPNYIYALYRYYKKDYAVFGYKIPNLIHFWNFTDII